MQLLELIQKLQEYHATYGDMEFSIEVLDQAADSSMMGAELLGIDHDDDDRGRFGWMSVRKT